MSVRATCATSRRTASICGDTPSRSGTSSPARAASRRRAFSRESRVSATRAAQDAQQVLVVEGLHHVVGGAALQRVDRGLDGGERGHDHDRRDRRRAGAGAPSPRRRRALPGADRRARRRRDACAASFSASSGSDERVDGEAVARQELAQDHQVVALVVDDQDARASRLGLREHEREVTSLPAARDGDAPAGRGDDALHDRESEARAARAPTEERLEDALEVALWNPRSVIRDVQSAPRPPRAPRARVRPSRREPAPAARSGSGSSSTRWSSSGSTSTRGTPVSTATSSACRGAPPPRRASRARAPGAAPRRMRPRSAWSARRSRRTR